MIGNPIPYSGVVGGAGVLKFSAWAPTRVEYRAGGWGGGPHRISVASEATSSLPLLATGEDDSDRTARGRGPLLGGARACCGGERRGGRRRRRRLLPLRACETSLSRSNVDERSRGAPSSSAACGPPAAAAAAAAHDLFDVIAPWTPKFRPGFRFKSKTRHVLVVLPSRF
ncbi:hypothetical protein NL676_001930 [Syzygium grande]|nr:hypothetical protein NL676_001930 [Syzygium grande]